MFERLTNRTEGGIAYTKIPANPSNMIDVGECYTGRIIDRIAAYEDSELSPEEVTELTKAKAEGRLVMLPCKIGDEVWFLEKQLDIANGTCSTVISEYIVTEIRGNKYNPLWYMASSERCTHRDFHPTKLGKTVFLSREAAENALAEAKRAAEEVFAAAFCDFAESNANREFERQMREGWEG